MTNFVPLAGSICAVAMVDPKFVSCKWIYGRTPISESFGDNSYDYWTEYQSQIWRFEQIRDHTIFDLSDEPLDETRTRLKASLRDRLGEWVDTIQGCEGLIIACEGAKLESDEAVVATEKSTSSTLITSPTLTPATTRPSSEVPLTPSASLTLPQPAIASDRDTEPMGTRSNQPTTQEPSIRKKRFKRKILKVFSKQDMDTGHRHSTDNSPQSSGNGQGATMKHPTDIPVVSGTGPSDAQEQSLPVAQHPWAQKRNEFIGLLQQLNDHADFFSSEIRPRQKRSVTARLLRGSGSESQVQRYRDASDRLRALIQSLQNLPETDQVEFQLMLHNDPRELQSRMREKSRVCNSHFQPQGAVFYMRLHSASSPPAGDSSSQPLAVLRQPDTEARYIMFDVSPENAASEAGDRIEDLHLIISSALPAADRHDWAVFLGYIDKTIRVFSDSTTHSAVRSFVACLADRDEQRHLRKSGNAGFRARLAFVAASSLFYSLCAEGPRDLEAQHLQYYTARNEMGQEPGYKDSRINPYFSLRTLGATAVKPSSAAALSAAAGTDSPESTMIKNLGVLLYEIGAWSSIAGREVAERVQMVKREKEHLMRSISPKYRDVVDACFGYEEEDSVEDWVIKNVLMPLKKELETIKSIRLIST